MKDVFEIQDDISRAIVGALEVQLGSGADSHFVRPPTTSTEAYELYVKGRVLWNQRGPGLTKALHYFELTLLEDPKYALAWSGLADAYSLLGFYDYLDQREAYPKAKVAAEKAVSLDEQSAEAHCSLAWIREIHDWNLKEAERHFLRALELNPNYTPSRYWYATNLTARRRYEDSLSQDRRAIEGDPLSVFAHAHLGWMLIGMHRFAEAVPPLRRCLDLKEDFGLGRWLLGRALWFLDQKEAAMAEFDRGAELSGRLPMVLSTLGWALGLSGQTDRAKAIQRELTDRTSPATTRPLLLANVHVGLGENDQAFEALDRALVERDHFMQWTATEGPSNLVELSGLEAHPRWQALIHKAKAAIDTVPSTRA
jgi:tetratricopeptide (TPR) repeat protein